MQAINLGNQIDCYEIQNYGEFRMAVTGDWGVTVLDSSGVELWSQPKTFFSGTYEELMCDIDDEGNVAVLTVSSNLGQGGRFYVFDRDGNLKNPTGKRCTASTSVGIKGDVYNTKADYPQDIAIKGNTVVVIGFNNDKLTNICHMWSFNNNKYHTLIYLEC